MKKLFAILLCLALCFGFAFAEENENTETSVPNEPALVNPAERYEFVMDSTDGSDELIMGLLDTMNDENTLIEENGSLVSLTTMYDGGEAMLTTVMRQQMSEAGNLIITSIQGYEGAAVYSTREANVVWQDGEMQKDEDETDAEVFDWQWESFRFPYMGLDHMMSINQDNNISYYLFQGSDESLQMEVVTESAFDISQLRIYVQDDNGDYALNAIVEFDVGPAEDVPQEVLDLLMEKDETQTA